MSSSSDSYHPRLPQRLRTPYEATSSSPSPNSSSYSVPSDFDISPTTHFPRSNTAPGELSSTSSSSSRRNTSSIARTDMSIRGGCWTCRIRRKKCDEEQVDGACKACRRLQIQCLGWGPRRPDWMRDKQAVEQFKAEIKAQLGARGMIRGQPKLQNVPAVPSISTVPGAGPSRTAPSGPSYPASFPPPDFSHYSSANTGAVPNYVIPSQSPPNFSSGHSTALMFDPSSAPQGTPYGTLPFVTSPSPAPNFELPPSDFIPQQDDAELRDTHITYYFQTVRQYQFPFMSPAQTSSLHELVMRDRSGPIANVVCALAALHHTRTQGPPGTPADETVAQRFHQHAHLQLAESRAQHGAWTETDAAASVLFVSYAVLSGRMDWSQSLSIACEWLDGLNLHTAENPKVALLKLDDAGRFAAKATMWMDVFASISLRQPPRFMDLYRRLFAPAGGYWARGGGADDQDLDMLGLTGCQDEVLLALAETSTLAHWKYNERLNRRLSVRDLVRRSDDIEQRYLVQRTEQIQPPTPSSGASEHISLPSLAAPTAIPPHRASPHASAQSSPVTQIRRLGSFSGVLPTENVPNSPPVQRTIERIFRDAAALYLFVVVNEAHPAVPEVRAGARRTIRNLADRFPSGSQNNPAMMLPLVIAGVLADDENERQIVRNKLAERHQAFGSVYLVRQLLETVWRQRDAHRGPVDWQRTMHDMGFSLLLI